MPGEMNTVLISVFRYQPDTLTVKAGETVEWKNADIVPHTVTAADGKAFDSGSIAKGASWRFTLVKSGTYDYNCTLHPNMKGKLVVQ
jgi:plastocyanin